MNTNNVVQLRADAAPAANDPGPPPTAASAPPEADKRSWLTTPWRLLKAATLALSAVARYAAYISLLTLRGPVRFLLRLTRIPAIISIPLAWIAMEGEPNQLLAVGSLVAVAAGTTVTLIAYDALLHWLASKPNAGDGQATT